MNYGIRIARPGGTFFLRANNLVFDYVDIELGSFTEDLTTLSDWVDYAENDLTNGSITSYKVIEYVRSARIVTPNTDDAARDRALNKLNPRDKRALGL